MNLFAWLGLVTLGCAWLFAVPFFDTPSMRLGLGLAAVGISALAWSIRSPLRRPNAWPRGLLALAAILASQAALVILWFRFGSHAHEVPGLAGVLAWGFELIGVTAHASGGTVFVQSPNHLIPFAITWELLGLLPASLMLAGAVTLLLATGKPRLARTLTRIALVFGAYGLVRFIALGLILIGLSDPLALQGPTGSLGYPIYLFSSPLLQLCSWLPIASLLAMAIDWRTEEIDLQPLQRPGIRAVLASLIVVVCAATATWDQTYVDAGSRKAGRVLIDSSKSVDWETTSRPFDTEWFGRESVYNFVTAKDYLALYFDVKVNEDASLDAALLAETDVLILKTPTRPFQASEIEAIDTWVEQGGGLYLIGDHTDLFGMSSHLNSLSQRFGITFNVDGSNALGDGGFAQLWNPPLFQHPILERVQHFTFLTSCTLDVPSDAEHVMIAGNTFSDRADYSKTSFFGDMRPGTDDSFGVHVLSALVRHGEGQVLAFSDSTLFSTFGVMTQDRPAFLLDSVEYLNRGDRRLRTSLFWLTLFGALAAGAAGYLYRDGRTFTGQVLPIAGTGGVLLGAWIAGLSMQGAMQAPSPHTEYDSLAIVSDNGDYELPAPLSQGRKQAWKAFDLLFVWAQRLNVFPRELPFEQALSSDAIVFLHPTTPLDDQQARDLEDYVLSGGSLMVVDSILSHSTAADSILSVFGMQSEIAFQGAPDARLHVPYSTLTDSLGEPTTDATNRILSVLEYGEGTVIGIAEGSELSRQGLISQMDVPDEAQRARFDLIFDCYRILFGRNMSSY